MSSKSDMVLVKETYPEPKTKPGFPALIREVLEAAGSVHRIVMERGQPVAVWRWAEKDEMSEGDRTLDGALAHAAIIEYSNPDPHRTAPEEIFHMMSVLASERLVPVCWATGLGSEDLLLRWLKVGEQGVPFRDSALLNVPIERLKSLPEDTLLLCGAAHPGAELGEVTLAVKTAIELREIDHGEEIIQSDASGGGHSAQERGEAARAQPDDPRGDNGTTWYPPRFLRDRFSGGGKVR